MSLEPFFKSILEQDPMPVVVCDLDHTIIYMNPSAIEHYSKWGGEKLLGKSLLDCHNDRSKELIGKVVDLFSKSDDNDRIHTFYNQKEDKDIYMVALRNDNGKLIGYYEKHESRVRDGSGFYAGI